jgi:hypothetical protein
MNSAARVCTRLALVLKTLTKAHRSVTRSTGPDTRCGPATTVSHWMAVADGRDRDTLSLSFAYKRRHLARDSFPFTISFPSTIG